MDIPHLLYYAVNTIYLVFYLGVGAAGAVGTVLAVTTRDDAFEAADRQPKFVWAALLAASAAVLILFGSAMSILSWIAAVIVGLYWFDVRPQIKNILDGNYGW